MPVVAFLDIKISCNHQVNLKLISTTKVAVDRDFWEVRTMYF